MDCATFQQKISEWYDDTSDPKVYRLGMAGGLSTDIGKLLADPNVFPDSQDYVVEVTEDPTIDCTYARFRGTALLPFPVSESVDGDPPRYPVELYFYLDKSDSIQLLLSAEIQLPDTSGFSLKQHFSQVQEAIAAVAFDWIDYQISSTTVVTGDDTLAATLAGPLEFGLNLTSKINLEQEGNAFSPMVWLFAANQDDLDFSGAIVPPLDPDTDPPVMALGSPQEATGLSLGSVSFTTAAVALQDDKLEGTGANIPLQLGGDLSHLQALGLYETPEAKKLTVTVVNDPGEQSSLDAFSGITGASFASIIPSEYPLGDVITIDDINMKLDLSFGAVSSFGLGITIPLDWTLIPNMAKLTGIGADFLVSAPTEPQHMDLGVTLRATSELSDGSATPPSELLLTAAPPTLRAKDQIWIFSGALQVNPDARLNILGVAAQLIPGVEAPDTPILIDRLDFTFSPNDKTFSFNVDLDVAWQMPLGFSVDKLKGSLAQTTNGMLVDLVALAQGIGAKWSLSLRYDTRSGKSVWTFRLMLQGPPTGEPLDLWALVQTVFANWGVELPPDLMVIRMDVLDLTIELSTGAFAFKTEITWKVSLLSENDTGIVARLDIQKTAATQDKEGALSGTIAGDVFLLGLEFNSEFIFAPNAKQVTFKFQEITAVYAIKPVDGSKEPHKLLTIAFGDRSLGEMLASLIGVADPGATTQLEGPWSFLNSINLNGLLISVDFTSQIYRVEYLVEKDFTLLYLKKLGIEYRKQYGKAKIKLILEATFFGKDYTEANALSWDPVNEQPPTVPGAGESSFELQFLGLGQHVAIRNVAKLTTVEEVLKAIQNSAGEVQDGADNPMTQLPGMQFDAGSNWLMGAQFVIKSSINVGMVFNDPEVYGLLITAGGPSAGSLKGLRFEILYRKISDSVGQWHVDLTLPQPMRKLQMGVVTVTMPVISIDIYTNGDFALDIGFPTTPTDFSRCFALEYFPFIGFGGFYFAKLSSETATQVPTITNGQFDPVIAFGIAMSVGLGKTIELGILSGGISITVTGIVEGVWARFLPTDESAGEATYLSLRGTIAIVGKVYATVDFGIIKASVDLMAYASVTLEIRSYEPMFIALEAGVVVSVRVKIVFIKIRFSFKATIRQEFSIGNYQQTPWVIGNPNTTADAADHVERLVARSARARRRAQREWLTLHPHPRGESCHLGAEDITPITVWTTPVVSKAITTDLDPWQDGVWLSQRSDEASPEDTVALASMFFVPTGAAEADTFEEIRASRSDVPTGGIESLMEVMLRWMLDQAQVGDKVSLQQLQEIFDNLQDPSVWSDWFDYEPLTDFISGALDFELQPRPTDGGDYVASYFPPIPELTLTAPGYQFNFGADGVIDEDYVASLDRYFAALMVDYANAVERDADGQDNTDSAARHGPVTDSGPGSTFAGYLFTRYFLAITRSAVGAAIDEMQIYHLPLSTDTSGLDPDTATLQDIADWFSSDTASYNPRPSDTSVAIAARLGLSLDQIQPAMTAAGANGGGPLLLNVPLSVYAIVEANQTVTGILRTWPAENPPAGAQQPSFSNLIYHVGEGDFLGPVSGAAESGAITTRFGVTLDALIAEIDTIGGLLQQGAALVIGDLQHTATTGETLQTIAGAYEQDALTLVTNDPDIALLVQTLVLPDNVVEDTQAGETLNAYCQRVGVDIPVVLGLNSAILVQVGDGVAPVQLKDVTHSCQNTDWILQYVYQDGDTLDSIARHFEPDADSAQLAAFARSIAEYNPRIDFSVPDDTHIPALVDIDPNAPMPPMPGDVIAIRYRETLEHIAIAFYGDAGQVSHLVVDANTTNPALLAPNAPMPIPTFKVAVDADSTFASLATRYGISLEDLSDRLADVPGLFGEGEALPTEILAEDVPSQPVDRLIAWLIESSRFTEAAGQMSRFMLQGLRLPAPGWDQSLEQQIPGLDADAGAIETWPMYALSGQEFPAPDPADGIALDLSLAEGIDWVTLVGTEAGKPLVVSLLEQELQQITAYGAMALDLSGADFFASELARVSPAQLSLGNPRPWQAAALPQAVVNPEVKAGQATVWALPDSLKTAVADSTFADPLQFGLYALRRTAQGNDDSRPLTHYAWATLVELRLQTVAVDRSDAAGVPGLYVLNGADEAGKHALLGVWDALRAGDSAEISILYAKDPANSAAGYLSGAMDREATRILQTNLSTQSNPETAALLMAQPDQRAVSGSDDGPWWTDLDNTSATEVTELLWRNSVTRSGGFYLQYRGSDGQGLPEWIFNQDGQATLNFLFVLDSQTAGAADARALYAFNNVALIGDPVDTSQEVPAAEVALVQLGNSTLSQTADRHERLGLQAEAIALAHASVPNLFRRDAQIVVDGDRQVGVRHGDSWHSIARRAGVTVTELVRNNLDNPVYRDGAWATVADDLVRIEATIPAGTLGFGLTRPLPDTFQEEDQERLQELFNLAGFQVTANSTLDTSAEGIPVSPTEPDDDGSGLMAALEWTDTEATADWSYDKFFRVSLLATRPSPYLGPGLPDPVQDPYAGIEQRDGELGQASVGLSIQDFLGNRSLATTTLGTVDVPLGYTDTLIGVDSWPGASNRYAFTGDGGADPQLNLSLGFAAGRYLPNLGTDFESSNRSTQVDRSRMATAHYQVWRTDTELTLTTSIGALTQDKALNLARLRDLDISIWVLLDQIAACTASRFSTAPADETPYTWGSWAAAHGAEDGTLAVANGEALLKGLFAAGQLLDRPVFTAVLVDDSLDELVNRTGTPLTTLVQENDLILLQAGTAMALPARDITLTDPTSVAQVAAENQAAVTSTEAGGQRLVTGLVDSNPEATLVEGQTIRYGDATLSTSAGDTFSKLAVELVTQQDEASATAAAVAVANPETRYEAQTLSVENRLLLASDTLDSVAADAGQPMDDLAAANQHVPSLFPDGTQLLIQVDSWNPADAPAAFTLSDTAAFLDLSLAEFGAWQADKVLAEDRQLAVPGLLDTSSVIRGTVRLADDGVFASALNATAGFSAQEFLDANQDLPGLFTPGVSISVGSGATTTLDSTFSSLAADTGTSPMEVWNAVADQSDVARPAATAMTTALHTKAADTLAIVSTRLGADPAVLGDANAATAGLLIQGSTIKVSFPDGTVLEETTGILDSLGAIADRLTEQLTAAGSTYVVSAEMLASQNPDLEVDSDIVLLPPVAAVHPQAQVTPETDSALLPLWVRAATSRSEDLVQPEFSTEATVYQAAFDVAPAALAGSDGENDPLTLQLFATAFETAFQGFKLATGTDRGDGTPAQQLACGTNLGEDATACSSPQAADDDDFTGPQIQLWALRFGSDGNSFGFDVDGGVTSYALPPLNTRLWTSNGRVPVQPYETLSGLGAVEDVYAQAVDIEAALEAFLEAMDLVLSPVAAPRLLDLQLAGDTGFDTFNGYKAILADTIAARVDPILQGAAPTDDALKAAVETARQRLLNSLSGGYGEDVIVQVPFTVTSPCSDPQTAARLSGKLQPRLVQTPLGTGGYGVQSLADDLLVDANYLLDVMSQLSTILELGNTVSWNEASVEVNSGDTLSTLAARLEMPSLADLLDVDISPGSGLLASGTTINLTASVADTASGLVTLMANALDATLERMLQANQNQPLFQTGTDITLDGDTRTVDGNGTPNDVMGLFDLTDLDQLSAALTQADLDSPRNAYTLDPDATTRIYRVPPVFSFTTGKLALASTDGNQRYFTSALSVQSPASQRFLSFDLNVRFTDMEYDILRDPMRLGDYQESSWLKLVLPASLPAAGDTDVGRQDIPMPLRAYPQTAVVTDQGVAGHNDDTPTLHTRRLTDRLRAALVEGDLPKTWGYDFTLQRVFAAQDLQTLRLYFNMPYGYQDETVLSAPTDNEALNAALYAFAYAQGGLLPDLALLADPNIELNEISRTAVAAFASLAEGVVDAWTTVQAEVEPDDKPIPYEYSVRLLSAQSNPTVYDTLILSGISGPDNVLFETEAPPANQIASMDFWCQAFRQQGRELHAEAQLVPPERRLDGGEHWLIVDREGRRTLELVQSEQRWTVVEKFLHPQIAVNDGAYTDLDWTTDSIGILTLSEPVPVDSEIAFSYRFQPLDILLKQNAIGSSEVSRNATLVAGDPTRAEFVYDTGEQTFPAIVTPMLVVSEELILNPNGESLETALTDFFEELVREKQAADPDGTIRMAVVAGFQFDLATSSNDQTSRTGPLLLRAPSVQFKINDQQEFIARLAAQTELKASQTGVPDSGGYYQYQLQVYSTIKDASQTVPVVSYTNLVFVRE